MFDTLRKRFELATFSILHRRSVATILRWQRLRLRQLLLHAFQNVPMWGNIIVGAHFNEKSLAEFDPKRDLFRLPVTSKGTYLGKMVDEYIDNSRRFIHQWGVTSGTTGTPFRFLAPYRTIMGTYHSEFDCFRFLLWEGKQFKDIGRTRIAKIKLREYELPFRLGLGYLHFKNNPREVFATLARFRPEVLSAYPTVLLDLAKMSREDQTLPILAPRYTISVGDTLIPSARSYVEESLSTEIYDRYGLEEIGSVGVECHMHNGFHLDCESLIVEVTDELGAPLAEGQYGKILITDLYNYDMPFIRYETGDYGKLSYEICDCGLCSPRLWVRERETAFLILGSRRVYRHEFAGLDLFMNQVLQHQVVKRSERELVLRIIPGPVWENSLIEKIEECIRPVVPTDIRILIECVSSISGAPRGKSNLLVDESQQSHISYIENRLI